MSTIHWSLRLVLSLIATLFLTSVAFAHERTTIGDYVVVVGWANEPPIVGERNAVLLQVSQGDQPVDGVEANLNLELLYGGRSFRSNLIPTGKSGEYRAELFPTVRGKYQVHLFGKLGEQAVDQTIEPEEVFAADRLQFPEVQPDLREMQTQVETLQGQLQTAQWIGYGGLALGLISLLLALFRRK